MCWKHVLWIITIIENLTIALDCCSKRTFKSPLVDIWQPVFKINFILTAFVCYLKHSPWVTFEPDNSGDTGKSHIKYNKDTKLQNACVLSLCLCDIFIWVLSIVSRTHTHTHSTVRTQVRIFHKPPKQKDFLNRLLEWAVKQTSCLGIICVDNKERTRNAPKTPKPAARNCDA